MQKRLVAILVFSLFESIFSYNVARICDPFTFTLDQILSDITFEIVPYPTYPNACPAGQSLCPSNPYIYVDESIDCGMPYPSYPICPTGPYIQPYPTNPYFCFDDPIPCGMPYLPFPNFLEIPCGIDTCPPCSCYRDIREPCIVYDEPGSLYICFEGFDAAPAPYVYFPQVEYPMSAMDIRPYYYGNCWCT